MQTIKHGRIRELKKKQYFNAQIDDPAKAKVRAFTTIHSWLATTWDINQSIEEDYHADRSTAGGVIQGTNIP
jgi:hypothetical protein